MSKKIICIDDDYEIIEPVFFPLMKSGYQILHISDFNEAIEKITNLREADLIILDIFFPQNDNKYHYPGLELLKNLRFVYKIQTPVIIFSVIGSKNELTEKFKELDVNYIVNKPIAPSLLYQIVEEILYQDSLNNNEELENNNENHLKLKNVMKYNIELAQKILEKIQTFPSQNDGKVAIDGYSQEEVSYHIKKLHEEGLVKGINAETFGKMEWLATDLTTSGHLFLSNLQKEKKQGDLTEKNVMEKQIDTRKVFVVHGRNWAARNALFTFLRSIGLHPLEWSEAVRATGKASPYVGEVLDTAFSNAQAIIVLMTPDDEARLREEYRNEDDESYEVNLTNQARPNVLFEAGMAMGRNPDRTVLIELGKLRPFSDIGGRHVIRLNGTTQKRQDLAHRLQTAGCDVNLHGTDWHTDGDFDSVLESIKKKNKSNMVEIVKDEAKAEFKLTPTFNFQCSRLPEVFNDQCSLNIKFKNEGIKTIRDFRIDILFPNDFLNQYTSYGLEVTEKRTDTHRLFRVLPSFNRNQPLYTGDEIMPMLSYEVSEAQKTDGSLKQKLFIDIYVEDNHTLKLEKEMSEFVKADESKAEKKLDETVPGGRYIVNGKVVNANGEEIE